jgi:hypothetical protein
MAPTIVAGHTTAVDASNESNHVINTPTHSSGNKIYIAAAVDFAGSSMGAPAGFAPVSGYENVAIGTTILFSLWSKTAGGSEGASYTWTSSVAERSGTIAWAVADDGGIHATGTPATGSSGTATVPAVTTSVTNCLRISLVFGDNDISPFGDAAGHTNLAGVGVASGASVNVQYKALPSSGTDGSQTVSLGASDDWEGITIAIGPTGTTYNQAIGGSVGLSGSLTAVKSVLKVLTGSVGVSGTVGKGTTKAIGGTLTPTGQLTRSGTSAASLVRARKGSIFSTDKLSFLIGPPAWNTDSSAALGDYSQEVTSYDHTHNAVGGFWTANLTLRLPLKDIEEWIENGVGRQIGVRGRATKLVWEGVVNRVSISIGGYNIVVGPYLDIANKVKLTYSLFLQLGGGEAVGIRVVTDYLEDTSSQGKYGILEKNFSAGGIDSASVNDLQAMLLERYRQPPRSEDLTLPGEIVLPYFDMKLECIGYAYLFQKYVYNSSSSGTQDLSVKLAAIVAAEPNALFSSTVTENTVQVPAYENDDNEAWGMIKALVAMGDASLNRYVFGVYENRRAIYKAVDNDILYIRPLREGTSIIQDSQGGFLQPWEIRPGGYVMITDLLPGKPVATNLNDDRRVLFADTVQYRMPDGLVINGSHAFRVEQRIAQLGLSGVS